MDSLRSFFCSKVKTSSSVTFFLVFFFEGAFVVCLGGGLDVEATGAFSFFFSFFFREDVYNV